MSKKTQVKPNNALLVYGWMKPNSTEVIRNLETRLVAAIDRAEVAEDTLTVVRSCAAREALETDARLAAAVDKRKQLAKKLKEWEQQLRAIALACWKEAEEER